MCVLSVWRPTRRVRVLGVGFRLGLLCVCVSGNLQGTCFEPFAHFSHSSSVSVDFMASWITHLICLQCGPQIRRADEAGEAAMRMRLPACHTSHTLRSPSLFPACSASKNAFTSFHFSPPLF